MIILGLIHYDPGYQKLAISNSCWPPPFFFQGYLDSQNSGDGTVHSHLVEWETDLSHFVFPYPRPDFHISVCI